VSGFYAWVKRPKSMRQQANECLAIRIQDVHEQSRQTYGSPRIQAELKAQGERVGRQRIARLMAVMGLKTRCRRRLRVTTQADKRHRHVENQLKGVFTAATPNETWLVDITYIETCEGWLYLAGVLDVYSRRIVGWSMQERMDKTLVCDALKMAYAQRGVPQRHHSDRGSQYTSHTYLAMLEQAGVQMSMSGVGRCYDNAMKESFWATLKTECADHIFVNRQEARRVIFEYIEVWYNRQRRHSALGYLSPSAFEQRHACP
jgi:putative transposase